MCGAKKMLNNDFLKQKRIWNPFGSKAKLLQLKLLQIFARDIFLMKKLEIEKTKPTFIISVLKVEY